MFRKFEGFPRRPNPYVQCGKRPLPRLLEVFPDAKDQIIAYGVENLAGLTIERVHDHIICKVIPRLIQKWIEEDGNTMNTPTTNSTITTSTNESTAANNTKDAAVEEHRIDAFHSKHGPESMGLSTRGAGCVSLIFATTRERKVHRWSRT